MNVILPNGMKETVKDWAEASNTFKNHCMLYEGEFDECAGEIRGGEKDYYIGKVDSNGNIFCPNVWPLQKKMFDAKHFNK